MIRPAVHKVLTMLHAMGQNGETGKDAADFCRLVKLATMSVREETGDVEDDSRG